jgi:uncharacterized caspase-like protein
VKPTSTAGLDAAYAPRRVALLIGVDAYYDPELQTLSFAGKDARDLAAALQDPAGGDYDEVTVVTGKDATTAEGIVHAIREATADLQRDDTFLLYLSGHGTLDLDPIEGTRLFFLPSDGKLGAPADTALEVATIEDSLSKIAARRRVLILDTCHNGRGRSGLSDTTQARLRQLRGDPPPPAAVAAVSESEARLYAAQYYQPAMEDPNLQNGVYTHFLIQAITSSRTESDLDGDGLVSVREAHDYAMDGTIRYTGGLQVPRIEVDRVGNEEIFLAGNPSVRQQAEHALLSAYEGVLASARVWIDGTPRGELPGLVPVDPGRRHVEITTADGRTLVSRDVRVEAGSITALEDLLEPQRSTWTVALGAVAFQGPAAELMLPRVGTEIEAAWAPPMVGVWAQEIHVRGSLGMGIAPDLQADGKTSDVTGGLATVGGFVGMSPWPDRLVVGPELEVGALWRTFDLANGSQKQAGFVASPGLRARASFPISEATALQLRYDVRAVPYRNGVDDEWTAAVAHGATVGVSFR